MARTEALTTSAPKVFIVSSLLWYAMVPQILTLSPLRAGAPLECQQELDYGAAKQIAPMRDCGLPAPANSDNRPTAAGEGEVE
jgi:hypothetical protein